jgi:predicted glycosyltransferase
MHWYSPASAIDTFFSQIEAVSAAGGGKPVFITEFQPSGTVEEITGFLQEALPKLDSNSNVLGYSYFMVANSGSADGLNLMASATDASTIGLTYAST